MKPRCSNCRFADLDKDVLPCRDCVDENLWCRQIEEMWDSREMLFYILDTQMYILRELGDLRGRLDKLEPGQWDLTLKRKD